MSETLEERVARLEAVEAIQDLKNTYHTYVNDTAFDKIPDLFTEDAYVHPSSDYVTQYSSGTHHPNSIVLRMHLGIDKEDGATVTSITPPGPS